jgi:hypothetical protein
MTDHKFPVGEVINFKSSLRNRSAPAGNYVVIGHRPPDEGEPCYRIKSELERHERIALESELRWIS